MTATATEGRRTVSRDRWFWGAWLGLFGVAVMASYVAYGFIRYGAVLDAPTVFLAGGFLMLSLNFASWFRLPPVSPESFAFSLAALLSVTACSCILAAAPAPDFGVFLPGLVWPVRGGDMLV